jgi:hypothetical protein
MYLYIHADPDHQLEFKGLYNLESRSENVYIRTDAGRRQSLHLERRASYMYMHVFV